MTVAVVIAGALLLIFFGLQLRTPSRRTAAAAQPAYQDVFVAAADGIEPATIVVVRGVPAKLRIHRSAAESEEIRIERFNVTRRLVPGKTTTIDLEPDEAGAFEIRAGSGSRAGTLLVIEKE